MDTKELLRQLDEPYGISGNESAAGERVIELLEKYCSDIKRDRLGNIIAEYPCGKSGAPRLMIEAHMDELGLMVSGFAKEGSLLFVPIGGFDQKVLPGSEVTVHSAVGDYFGVIGAKPPHLITDRSKSVRMADMSIDVGFDEETARKIFAVGDLITFNTGYTPLDADVVAGRCYDNRAGVACLIKALEYMEKYRLECDITVCVTVQEEVGLRGARVVCRTAKPDAAIVVDAGFGISQNSDEGFELGSGAIVSVGPNLHPKLTDMILECAKEEKLGVEIDVEGGNTGTDAWEVQVSGNGVPTALISFPLRYMHSTYEAVDANDVNTIAKLIAASAVKFKGGDMLCY